MKPWRKSKSNQSPIKRLRKGIYFMKTNVINLKNATRVAFVASQNDTATPILSVSLCSKEDTAFYQPIFEFNSVSIELHRNQLNQIFSQAFNIVAEDEETKTLLLNDFYLYDHNIITMYELALEIFPEYVINEYSIKCGHNLYGLLSLCYTADLDIANKRREMMEIIVSNILHYDSLKTNFTITHKSDLLEKLIDEIYTVQNFAMLNICKNYGENTYDENSFMCVHSHNGIVDLIERSCHDNEDSFFNELSKLLQKVRYVICYNSESINRLQKLYANFNKSYTFAIINLQSIADTILNENIQSCEELYLRFLCGYDYDCYFEYYDMTCELYTILKLMIEEYKEVKDTLND